MIKTVFKAHPIMIFRQMKPYLFVLILPLVRAVVQYFTKGETNGLLMLELIALGFVLAAAILGWQAIKITVGDRYITVEKGVLIKSRACIEISRLSSISLKQNIFDFVLGSVSCEINTEAGTPKKSDFDIKMGISDAKRLYSIVYGTENMQVVKFSAFRIALLAATTSSAATGLIVGIPVINKTSDLVGVAISDMLLDEINNVSSKFNNIFPPIVNTVTIILIIAYGVSVAVSFFKNVNFRLESGKNSVEVRSGLIVRKKITFKKTKINNICFEQTPLMRIVKKYSMRASIGGYGDKKGEKAVIVPVANHNELEKHLKMHFPFFETTGRSINPIKSSVNKKRFLYPSAIVFVAIVAVSAVLMITLPYFDKLIFFLTVVAVCINLYYADVCYHNYKYGKLCLGDYILASGSTGFTVRELYCDKSKIGVIKLIETPADRKLGTCKVKLTVCSESADSVRVKNIGSDIVNEQIKKAFNLNI